MKILRLGDPHGKVSNLDEMSDLINFVTEIAIKEKVERIEILGDLFHTHAILRLEVLDFWIWALELLADICEVIVLVGNHDMSGDYNSNTSALDVFMKLKNKNLHIVNIPRVMGTIGYVPYMHDGAKFVDAANHLLQYGAKILVCHQTFNGSKFENGFYAPDGIDPELVKFDLIISGHIHAQQKFGKVIYPGTARWDTASDANQPKGIWIYTHDDANGDIISEEFISTEKICKPIYSFTYREGDTTPPSWQEGAKVAVELVGSSVWVVSQKEKLKGKCSVKTKITDKQNSETRKTGGNLEHFISNMFVSTMDKGNLLKLAKEYGIV